MTSLSYSDAPPLRTDTEVLDRVRAIVGPAQAGRQLWVLLLDGDNRQLPAVIPISGPPRAPDRRALGSLARLLGGLRAELATSAGPGSVVFVLERAGSDTVLPGDLEWAGALRLAGRQAEVATRAVFLSTDAGVRPLAAASNKETLAC
ncbi:MAG TPA: hypothetical protein VGM60_14505 [Pseudonocardia sp.]|jgi:hypothetical protein|uniref:hypothetical protein n=1 Tax=Pseudonocardia sp. TaxID=60912 RepID=UPI002F3E2BE1